MLQQTQYFVHLHITADAIFSYINTFLSLKTPKYSHFINKFSRIVPWLRRLVAGLSPQMHGFDPGSIHVGFVVDKVALGQVFPRVIRFSPVNFIPPVLYYKEKRKN
jgi:hypothetical protein